MLGAPLPPHPTPPAGGGAFAEQTAWPEFHNGVAAGLRLAPGAHQLTRTWVVYNKPAGGWCTTSLHLGGAQQARIWVVHNKPAGGAHLGGGGGGQQAAGWGLGWCATSLRVGPTWGRNWGACWWGACWWGLPFGSVHLVEPEARLGGQGVLSRIGLGRAQVSQQAVTLPVVLIPTTPPLQSLPTHMLACSWRWA